MADAFGTPGGVVSAVDHRLAQAGLIAPQSTSIAVRTGVLYAPGAAALVTGTAATGTMTVSVAAHHWVTTRGTADGVYLGCLPAATTVNIAAAPGANSRIDVVYVKQNDAASTISPDGSTGDVYEVALGTAAASPTKPSIPAGALELATVTVAAGATATNGAGVTISNTARLTSARGAAIPVRSQAERDALTTFTGLRVQRIDASGRVEWWSGAEWRTTSPITVATMASRPTTGRYAGMQVWDNATAQPYTYDGTYWRNADAGGYTPAGVAAGNYITGKRGQTSASTDASGNLLCPLGMTFAAATYIAFVTSGDGNLNGVTQAYPLSAITTTSSLGVGVRNNAGATLPTTAVKVNWHVIGYNT